MAQTARVGDKCGLATPLAKENGFTSRGDELV